MGTRFLSRITAALFALLLPAPAYAALQFSDIACETSTTTGTGTLNLGGALSGYLGFAAAGITSGNTVPYQIRSGGNLETGIGTFTDAATDTLARTTVKYSTSGAGTALNLSADSVVCIGPISALFTGGGTATSWNPTSSDGASLGTTSLMWSDLFLASGAVVNFNNGDVTITHSANALAFAGVTGDYTFDDAIKPSSNDGAALGASGTAWSDLYLASGAVIDWNSANVVLTQSALALTMTTTDAGAQGPTFTLDQDSATPANSDIVASLTFQGNDSAANNQEYGQINSTITDVTSTSEDSSMSFDIQSGGSALTALTLGTTDPYGFSQLTHQLDFGSNFGRVVAKSSSAGVNGAFFNAYHASASPAANDTVGSFYGVGKNSLAADAFYGGMNVIIVDPTSASEDSKLGFDVLSAGSTLTALTLGTTEPVYSGPAHIFDFGTGDGGKLEITGSVANNNGPMFVAYHNSASPAAGDYPGGMQIAGKDSLGNIRVYAEFVGRITDPTAASEDSAAEIWIKSAATEFAALTLGTTVTSGEYGHIVNGGTGDYPAFEFKNTSATTGGPYYTSFQDSASPAASDNIGGISFRGRDSAANSQMYGQIDTFITDPTSGSEDSYLILKVQSGGSALSALTLGGSAITSVGGWTDTAEINLGSGAFPALLLYSSSASTFGSTIVLQHDSASPAANDVIGQLDFRGRSSTGVERELGYLSLTYVDTTNASEDTKATFGIWSGGAALNALTLGTTTQSYSDFGSSFDFGSDDFARLELVNSSAATGGPILTLYHNSASPAANDFTGSITISGEDSVGSTTDYAQIGGSIADTTNASEDGYLVFKVIAAGTNATAFAIAPTAAFGDAAGAQVWISSPGTLGLDNRSQVGFYETEANGDNAKFLISPAAVTADTTCTFEDDANFIPDSCVGNGVDDVSDERLKENFVPAGDVGTLIDGIKIYDYTWKQDLPELAEIVRKGAHGFGPKAQELYKSFPYLVRPGGDDPAKDPWEWLPDRAVPYLIVEAQNLRKRVAELEGKASPRCYGIKLPIGCIGLSM